MNEFVKQMHALAVWAEANGFPSLARAAREAIEKDVDESEEVLIGRLLHSAILDPEDNRG